MDEHENLIIKHIKYSLKFRKLFKFNGLLGKGSDGRVNSYQHVPSGQAIAVKVPRFNNEPIQQEARVLIGLCKYGKHENIAHHLTYEPEFGVSLCPAIFFPLAEYGDLMQYRNNWLEQEHGLTWPHGMAEVTVWKLFKDVLLALNHLHTTCGLVHGDIKPGNILVTAPPGHDDHVSISTMPVFKLCDFSRATKYPSSGREVHPWAGTLHYSPPPNQRHHSDPVQPSSDMWAFGATLQEFALGVSPMLSRDALADQLAERGEPHPDIDDDNAWRVRSWCDMFHAVYRPLDVNAADMMIHWDLVEPLSDSYQPFGATLNSWYMMLWEMDPKLRVSARSLAKQLLPLIDTCMVVEKVDDGEVGVGEVEASKPRADSLLNDDLPEIITLEDFLRDTASLADVAPAILSPATISLATTSPTVVSLTTASLLPTDAPTAVSRPRVVAPMRESCDDNMHSREEVDRHPPSTEYLLYA